MAALKRKKLKLTFIIIGALLLLLAIILIGLMLYGKAQMKKIPGMSFNDCIEYTLKDSNDGLITVGIVEDGEATYKVYGKNAKILEPQLHTYEIGSLTKTITAAMIAKAEVEGKIDINKTIDNYLILPAKNNYPTISELLTHTSGYKGYYFASPMTKNFFKGRNDFYGITDKMILDKLSKLDMNKDEYGFKYSNYGYAVLGLILETIYNREYTDLVNEYVKNDLGLANTKISDGSGDLKNYWAWCDNDAYMSAGALNSNIVDMLEYAKLQLTRTDYIKNTHDAIKNINASSSDNKMMEINMDKIGMGWIIDDENKIIWHNGATGDYNCYLGFSLEKNKAVIILSNLAKNYKIPATVLGVKLLISLSE